jgi:hypothetical protein
MTRHYLSDARKRRITQPLRVVERPRDPAITSHGFTCFRLVDGDPIELSHSKNTMFAFVRAVTLIDSRP